MSNPDQEILKLKEELARSEALRLRYERDLRALQNSLTVRLTSYVGKAVRTFKLPPYLPGFGKNQPVYPRYEHSFRWYEKLMIKLGSGGPIFCRICGEWSKTTIRTDNLRDDIFCENCGSFNRQRLIAYIVCSQLTKRSSEKILSYRDLSKVPQLTVYNTESKGPVHDNLAHLKNYICSEYFGPEYRSGEQVNGVMHQDLMQLALPDESVDILITSDVFEHIPDPYKAHAEIYRVLKKGGRHVFSVPFLPTAFTDDVRAYPGEDNGLILLKEPIYHEDPVNPASGILVYNIFGLEMLAKLNRIGFRTNFYVVHDPVSGLLGPGGLVFEAIKD